MPTGLRVANLIATLCILPGAGTAVVLSRHTVGRKPMRVRTTVKAGPRTAQIRGT